MTEGTQGQGTENLTYPTNPVDVHTPPTNNPPPPPPPPALGFAAAALAVLAVGAHLLGRPVLAVWLMMGAEGLSILLLAAMPYTGPIVNPPPPPPPTRGWRALIATAAILFGLAVLGFGLQSRLGFLDAGVAGIVAALGGLMTGRRTVAAPRAGG